MFEQIQLDILEIVFDGRVNTDAVDDVKGVGLLNPFSDATIVGWIFAFWGVDLSLCLMSTGGILKFSTGVPTSPGIDSVSDSKTVAFSLAVGGFPVVFIGLDQYQSLYE